MRIVAEIALVRRLVLVVAFHAVGHRDGFLLPYRLPRGDRAVADRAIHPCLLVMRFVRKIDGLRKLVDPDPGDRRSLFRESGELANRRAVRLDGQMAAHAGGFSRITGPVAWSLDGVAV